MIAGHALFGSLAKLKLLEEGGNFGFMVWPGSKTGGEVLRLLDPQLMPNPSCLQLLRQVP